MAVHICNQEKRINELYSENKEQKEKIDKLYHAMFGNKETGDAGIKKQVQDVHSLLLEGNAIKKFMMWFFGTLMAVAGFIYTIIRITKETRI